MMKEGGIFEKNVCEKFIEYSIMLTVETASVNIMHLPKSQVFLTFGENLEN